LKRYLVAHWRGELSLAKSFLVNGLLFLVVLSFAVPGLGLVIGSKAFDYVLLAIWLIWEIWAFVGIFRCALRTFRETSSTFGNTWARRGFAVLAVALSAAAVYATIEDLRMLAPHLL
jgi:hypothetical protein